MEQDLFLSISRTLTTLARDQHVFRKNSDIFYSNVLALNEVFLRRIKYWRRNVYTLGSFMSISKIVLFCSMHILDSYTNHMYFDLFYATKIISFYQGR